MLPNLQVPPTVTKYFPLKGGFNLITPPLSMPDGMCRDSLNFECAFGGGYTRVAGYERYDGRSAPSSAIFYKINCTFTGAVAAGDTVTGVTSAATGFVILVDTDFIIITKKSGNFESGEDIQVGGVTKATTTSEAMSQNASSAQLTAQYSNLAADAYRADIGPVPGSGSVLGVWCYNDECYAFRNNAGGTAAEMYMATTGGWTKVNFEYEIAFTNASTSVEEGDTLTQGGVTATIRRIMLQTGTLLSGTNTGRMVISAPAGGNFAAGAATSTGGGSLTLSGTQSAITLPAGGRYEFMNYNFGGGTTTERMYGCNGVGRAFEFDGTVFAPITTGMVSDTPSHIYGHVNHLFLSFDGSVQNSSIGAPFTWSVTLGAAEITMGVPVTGFLALPGSESSPALAIFCDNRIGILYGASSADWQLVPYSQDIGAKAYTIQNVGQTYFLDVFGLRQLQASQAFGNFEQGQVSQLVSPFLEERIGRAAGSYVVRKKNQYRLFFNDRYGITLTFSANRLVGLMPFYYAHTMTCACSAEISDGTEMILCGGSDGYVYRMERGTSFDGDAIDASLVLAFNHLGSPRARKRYRRAVYELTGTSFSFFEASYELGYGSDEIDQTPQVTNVASLFSSKNWDSFTWDAFYWDGRSLLPAEQGIDGVAENISLILRSSTDYVASFTVNSVILHFTPRRQMR